MSIAAIRPTKKATNITLSADVLIEAKALGINISQVCDQFLRERIRLEREQLWQKEHTEFIANYNASVEQQDLPLQEWRTF